MKDRYLTLDAIRGTAAIAVLMLHGADWFGVLRPQAGYLAVDLFFALSGFIIARVYGPRLQNGLGFASFVGRRVARLWPFYFLGTLLGLIVSAIAAPSLVLVPQFIGAVFLLPTGSEHLYPLNRVAWSLGLELAVNLAFGAAWRVLTTGRLVAFLAISGVWLIHVALRDGDLQGGYAWATLDTGIARCAFSFTLGLVLERIEPHVRIPRLPAWLLVIAPLALTWRSGGAVADLIVVMLLFPILLSLATGAEPKWGGDLAAKLGLASYALYAVHRPVISLIDNGVRRGLGIDLGDHAPASGLMLGAAILLFALTLAKWDVGVRRRIESWKARSGPSRP